MEHMQKQLSIKKRSERRKHCAPAAVLHRLTEFAMAAVRQSQNSPPPQTSSRGRRAVKI